MRLGEVLKAINRYASLPVCVLFVFGYCFGAHKYAEFTMELIDRLKPMDSRTAHNVALIDFVSNHPGLAVGYFVFFEILLICLPLRRCPRWSSWLVFGVMLIPCCMYWFVCAYIVGKPLVKG